MFPLSHCVGITPYGATGWRSERGLEYARAGTHVLLPARKPADLQQPSLQQPSLQQPSLQQPSLQQPFLQQPSLQQPSLQQPKELLQLCASERKQQEEKEEPVQELLCWQREEIAV